jgi:hypothetical protein
MIKKITKPFLVAFVVFGCVAALGSTASANTLQINLGNRQSGVGGEFNIFSADSALNPVTLGYSPAFATMANVGPGMGFETFCVEDNEVFSPGGTYYYQIGQVADAGGAGGPHPDPLSLGAAWLYLNFAHGTLAGYNYTIGALGNASAADLQNTIWWLEEEAADPGSGNIFRNLVVSQFGSVANARADNNGFFGVGILNLWANPNNTGNAQDQLVLVPDGGTTASLLGVGLLGIFLGYRRVARKRPLSA